MVTVPGNPSDKNGEMSYERTGWPLSSSDSFWTLLVTLIDLWSQLYDSEDHHATLDP